MNRSTPLKRSPMKRTYRNTGPSADLRDAVLERDHWSCVVCNEGLCGDRGTDWSIHHRVRRSQRTDNSPENLISVCGNGTRGCHGLIHAGPTWARDFGGWYLKGHEPPLFLPVLIERGSRWVYLSAACTYTTDPPGVSA